MELLVFLFIVNFVRTLFIIVIIYYGVRLISRYVLPFLLEKGVKNMQDKMNQQQGQNQRPSKREGEVTIEQKRQNDKNFAANKGDYVDFEEVD